MADKWTEIRSLAEQGASYQSLSEAYGETVENINKRSFREGWLTPSRVKVKIQELQKLQCPQSESAPQNTASSEKAGQILAETWQQKAENLRILSFETAVDAIKRAKGLIAIETASDLKAAVHVARQATGVLDTEAPAISLNLGGSGGFFSQAGPVYEATEPEGIGEPEGPPTLEGCGV
jgi:hypothetical protein